MALYLKEEYILKKTNLTAMYIQSTCLTVYHDEIDAEIFGSVDGVVIPYPSNTNNEGKTVCTLHEIFEQCTFFHGKLQMCENEHDSEIAIM
jgi:hypothetical protein